MKLLLLVLAALATPQRPEETPTDTELAERFFYESFLPLPCLLFLIETNNMSEGSVAALVRKTVLPARAYIARRLPSKTPLDILRTFQSTAPAAACPDRTLQTALSTRNSHLDADTSQIARRLLAAERDALANTLRRRSIKSPPDPARIDTKYLQMVLALKACVSEGRNIQRAVGRERSELARYFAKTPRPSHSQLKELRALVSLAAPIFHPSILLQILSSLMVPDRDAFIEKNVAAIIRPLETLEASSRHMPNVEKKHAVLDFLRACRRRTYWSNYKAIDNAFHARSLILDAYFRTETRERAVHNEQALDRHHDLFLIDLIARVEALDPDLFPRFLLANKEIAKTYIGLLKSGQKRLEAALKSAF